MTALEAGRPYFTNGESQTQLICGHYEYRSDLTHPFMSELPSVIHIKSFDDISPDSVHGLLPGLMHEMQTGAPGASVVVDKLAEVLLVQVIRSYFSQADFRAGVIAGLFHPQLSRAFSLVHSAPERPLSLNKLADAAGMSRSSFASLFKTVVAMSPIAYLALWRMCIAHDLLKQEGLTVAETAFKVGYESDIAFSRAFKRHFAVNPSAVSKGA